MPGRNPHHSATLRAQSHPNPMPKTLVLHAWLLGAGWFRGPLIAPLSSTSLLASCDHVSCARAPTPCSCRPPARVRPFAEPRVQRGDAQTDIAWRTYPLLPHGSRLLSLMKQHSQCVRRPTRGVNQTRRQAETGRRGHRSLRAMWCPQSLAGLTRSLQGVPPSLWVLYVAVAMYALCYQMQVRLYSGSMPDNAAQSPSTALDAPGV